MKIRLIIFFFIYSNLIFGQDSIAVKKDINNEEKEIIKQTDVTKSDTINLELNSSAELIIPTETNTNTKIVMVKEKSKMDYLKYIFPIFTLILGIWLKRFIDKFSEKKRIKKVGKRWTAELRSLEEPLKNQINSLNDFLKDHLQENFKIPRINLYSSLDGVVFNTMDKNDLIEYIELNHKKTDFKEVISISNKIHGYTSILIHLHETLKEKFHKYLTGTSIHTKSLNKGLQSFNLAFKNYGVELEKELNSDPYQDKRYKPIADLYSKYIIPNIQDGNFNPFILEKDFFMPLVSVLSHLRLDNRTTDLSQSVTASLSAIKGIKLEKTYMTENVNTILTHYKEQVTELKTIIDKIENTKHNSV